MGLAESVQSHCKYCNKPTVMLDLTEWHSVSHSRDWALERRWLHIQEKVWRPTTDPPLGRTSSNTYRPVPFGVCNIKRVAVEVGGKQERRKSCKGEFIITGNVMAWMTGNQTSSKGSLHSCSAWRIFWEALGVQNFRDDISMHQRRQAVSNLGACWPQEAKRRYDKKLSGAWLRTGPALQHDSLLLLTAPANTGSIAHRFLTESFF